jgi:hypothetical protein
MLRFKKPSFTSMIQPNPKQHPEVQQPYKNLQYHISYSLLFDSLIMSI